ncbi:MAG TPA: hypothetical protein VLX61_09005 [Anaerolineales bacterium]|nr:hypothetical protein [Anaerolineales bacterium]
MNCYYHPDRPAIGVCKHCQRGLCAEDAALVDDSLSCKGRHEEQVRAMNQLMQRNLLQAKRVRSMYTRNAIFYFLTGALFAAFGYSQMRFTGLQGLFLLVVGLFLLFAAGLNFFEGRKYR